MASLSAITTWRSIRDKQLRREICQGIQSATDGEMSKVINLLGRAQQDGSVLLEQSRMVEFVSML